MPVNVMQITIPRSAFRSAPCGAYGERIYAIGDIHGRADLLQAMLAAIEDHLRGTPGTARTTRLIFLGDVLDRGGASRVVVEALCKASTHSTVRVLLGNHEASLLECLAGRQDPREGWLEFGGAATLESFGIDPPGPHEDKFDFADRAAAQIGPETVAWLRGLPLTESSGDFFFCHAGVRPGVRLDNQESEDLLWIRQKFTNSRRSHGKIIVHGHSESDAIEVRANRIGVDTGAYRTGRLSALAIEGEEVWGLTVS